MEVSALLVLLSVGISDLAVVELVERAGMLESEVVAASSVDVDVAASVVPDVDVALLSVVSEVVAVAVVVLEVVSSWANTPADKSVSEKSVERSSERFRDRLDALILALHCDRTRLGIFGSQ